MRKKIKKIVEPQIIQSECVKKDCQNPKNGHLDVDDYRLTTQARASGYIPRDTTCRHCRGRGGMIYKKNAKLKKIKMDEKALEANSKAHEPIAIIRRPEAKLFNVLKEMRPVLPQDWSDFERSKWDVRLANDYLRGAL